MKKLIFTFILLLITVFCCSEVKKQEDNHTLQKLNLEFKAKNYGDEINENEFIRLLDYDIVNGELRKDGHVAMDISNSKNSAYPNPLSPRHTSNIYYKSLFFKDSVVITFKETQKKIAVSFKIREKPKISNSFLTLNGDSLEFVEGEIKFRKVIENVSKITIKGKTFESDDKYFKGQNAKLTDFYVYKVYSESPELKKRNSIIIFDISDLTEENISDSNKTPFLKNIYKNSKKFINTVNYSPDKYMNLQGFLKCSEPYQFRYCGVPSQLDDGHIERHLINSSMLTEFSKSDFRTLYFSSGDNHMPELHGLELNNQTFYEDKKVMLEDFADQVLFNKYSENLFYVNLLRNEEEDYLKETDYILKQLFDRFNKEKELDDVLFLFISTDSDAKMTKHITMFYQKDNIQSSVDSSYISLCDISKTLMNSSNLEIPLYFSGRDLNKSDEFKKPEYYPGATEESVILYNDDHLYKKKKLSILNKYFYYDFNTTEEYEITDNIKKQELDSLFHSNLKGNYFKHILYYNHSGEKKIFKVKISSSDRFITYSDVADYYNLEKKNGKYELEVEVNSLSGCWISLYYTNGFQKFEYEFNKKYKISYGQDKINLGEKDKLIENSFDGLNNERYPMDSAPYNVGYDMWIYNRCVSY
jgi:hypothetical protein